MTATIVGPMMPRHASGDTLARVAWIRGSSTPGTLWERVAESAPSDLNLYALVFGQSSTSHGSALEIVSRVVGENIPQRVERIMREHDASPRAALRVALAESRLEHAKAAHPAGRGIKQEEGAK